MRASPEEAGGLWSQSKDKALTAILAVPVRSRETTGRSAGVLLVREKPGNNKQRLLALSLELT